MNFFEVEARFRELAAQRTAGRIGQEAFVEAVNALRVQDGQGRWWQIDSWQGTWLVWNGTAWESGQPPSAGRAEPAPPAPRPEAAADASGGRRAPDTGAASAGEQGAGAGRRFLDRFITPAGFLRESKRPIAERTQGWWDLLAIGGGILSGCLWFLYSSIRGVREGVDLTTLMLMPALPVAITLLRPYLDKLLAPVQGFRRRIPKLVLVGMAVVAPFASAFVLYALNYRQYELMHTNLILGTLLSYALLRNPARPGRPGGSQGSGTLSSLAWLGALSAAVLAGTFAPDVLADDCLRDIFNLNDCLRTDGFAQVIAGAATAVVSILVNGVEISRTIFQSPTPVEEDETPEQRNFSVHVHTLDAQGRPGTRVREGDAGVVYIYAYCTKDGAPFPPGDATVLFPASLGVPGLTIEDLGTLHQQRCARVSMPSPVQSGMPASVTVTVTAGQGQFAIPVTLQVELGLSLSAEMIHATQAPGARRDYPVFEARPNAAGDSWTFHELVVFFHAPESSEPIRPGFTPQWETPAFVPDFIELSPLVTDADQLTWRCNARMKPGARVPEDWLASDGIITLTFKCREPPAAGASAAKEYSAKLGLRLAPLLELAHLFDVVADEVREYRGIELHEGEFAADGEDTIGILFFVRSRLCEDPDRVADGYDLKSVKIDLAADARHLYELKPDPDFREPGKLRYRIRSRRPILHTREVKLPLMLQAQGEYAKTGSQHKSSLGDPIAIRVRPCPLYLRLWVVPGRKRGTSEAGAITGVRLARAPWLAALEGLDLELAVSSAGGTPALSIQAAPTQTVNADGESAWVLEYSGLTFANIGSAEFRVKCRIASCAEATVFTVSVGSNVLSFLRDLEDKAPSLRLTNPEFQHRSALGRAADYLWPDSTLGLLYNFRSMLAEKLGYPAPPEWNAYVCGELARRLLHWAMERRYGYGGYGIETSLKMNGIELGEYTFNHLHDFFGFNLSGNDPWAEAKFIDPWWNQAFDDQVVLSLTEERVKLVGSITFLISAGALVLLFVGQGLAATCAQYAPSVLALFRSYIYSKIKNIPFNPTHTVGVFGALGAIGTAYFWPTLWAELAFFEDDDLIGYHKYRNDWLKTQREVCCSSPAGGLPPVEAVEPW
ncbi:hypothetical protein [Thiocystis violacea]|uniref:hypothetical protein n=1 Tax=Thiocystis violacea TaxID=13725 RepID=UPI001906AB2F|nr:hypothetical protein [Thiocystis violacea]MBK1720280.1 hypothetical protein [Thiocystis violacea]